MSRRSQSAKLKVKIRRLAAAEGLELPAYQSAEAAGMDLVAAVPEDAPIVVPPGGRSLIPTGLVFELPEASEAQIRPRSGLAAKFGVTVLNSPGTIDADYRGEVSVILVNLGSAPFTIRRGDRIAQCVIATVARVKLREAKSLSKTKRGSGGFGSTGVDATPSPKRASRRKAITKSKRSAKTST